MLAGKVAVVTGASSGIGRAIALAYTKQGAKVVCADRDELGRATSQPTHSLIQAKGGRSVFVKTDVTSTNSVRQLINNAVSEYGRVDIMVNNAGIATEASEPRPVYETTEETFDNTWQVNVRGSFLGCKYAGQQMMKQQKREGDSMAGSIINLASVLGVKGLSGTAAYATSKGAVLALTRTVAMDYAPHSIHCSAILPGFTRTAMISSMTEDQGFEEILTDIHPLRRIGEPEEIADAAVFLASEQARGITGVHLSVDGGLHAQLRLK